MKKIKLIINNVKILNMKKLKFTLLAISTLFFNLGCEKQTLTEEVKVEATAQLNLTSELNFKTENFTKAFAKALANKELRELIKIEALKEFNNDYDVLFQDIKNKQIDGKSVISFISSFTEYESDLSSIINEIPLLTIHVPEIQAFSARNWDVNTQIPIVTFLPYDTKKGNRNLLAFDYEGKSLELESEVEPNIPVLVIKENERLAVKGNQKSTNVTSGYITENSSFYKNIDDNNFYFIDKSYNNSPNEKSSSDKIREENSNKNGDLKSTEATYSIWPWLLFDPTIQNAYTINSPCQRDNTYYSIIPGSTTGAFKNNYGEFMTSFFVENYGALGYLGDWTEGNLDFVVKIFFIDGNSSMTTLTKNFSCHITDLYLDGSLKVYTFPNPIEIVPFDLYRYGDTWKFSIYEYDANSTYSEERTISLSSKVSGNVSVSTKWGLGVEGSRTKSNTTKYTINNTSDELGEGVMYYTDPVIVSFFKSIGWPNKTDWYKTKVVSTGQVNLFVQPKKRY